VFAKLGHLLASPRRFESALRHTRWRGSDCHPDASAVTTSPSTGQGEIETLPRRKGGEHVTLIIGFGHFYGTVKIPQAYVLLVHSHSSATINHCRLLVSRLPGNHRRSDRARPLAIAPQAGVPQDPCKVRPSTAIRHSPESALAWSLPTCEVEDVSHEHPDVGRAADRQGRSMRSNHRRWLTGSENLREAPTKSRIRVSVAEIDEEVALARD
jgi:hypothetical protein